MIMEQIRDFFEIKTLAQDVKEIPADVDVLMVAQPDRLTPEAAYAIDQYVLGGGKVLAFVDPVAEMGARAGPMGMARPGTAERRIHQALKSWGVDFDPTKVVGDIATARRVQFGGGARPTVTEYVAWLGLDRRSIDEKDVLSGGIERLNLASAGFLAKAEGATTQVTPILLTSPQAMQIAAEKFGGAPDPVALLRAYKPEGKAADAGRAHRGHCQQRLPRRRAQARQDGSRRQGQAGRGQGGRRQARERQAGRSEGGCQPRTAKADAAAAAKPHKASGRINVIVVADTDMLADQFWVDVREFLGQQVAIPNASNAAFVVNALDNLSGSDALIALRGRGADDRPFKLVNELRREAERRYREKEQALTAKLKEVQEQLAKLESTGEGANLILSESDRQTIEKFRGDMLSVRRELREVKRALREDIDRLDGWLKFANIALVPLLIGFGGLGWAAFHRRRAGSSPARPASEGDANMKPRSFAALAVVTVVAAGDRDCHLRGAEPLGAGQGVGRAPCSPVSAAQAGEDRQDRDQAG